MKDTVVGAVLAILFLALLFAAPRLTPHGIEGLTGAEVAQISPGFSGTRVLGSWILQCSSSPMAKTTASVTQTVGRCRMGRGYRDVGGRLVLAVAFRYAGPAKALTMVVRYPPVGGQGQYLALVLGPKSTLRLPVFGCNKSSCVAVGALIPAAQSLLVSSAQAKVVLPRLANGRQVTIGIHLDGLDQALDGLHRAEL